MRAARFGPLHLFHHEEPGAFGDHEPIAILGEGPRGARGLLVPTGRHDAHQLKAAQNQRRNRRIHAARHHGIQYSHLNIAVGVAHGVGGGRAARRNDVAQPAESEAHGDFAGQRTDGAGGDGVHAALLGQSGVEQPVLLFGEILTAAAGTHDDADATQFVSRHGGVVESGIGHGLGHAGRGQRDGARNVRAVLDLHVLLLVELVGDFAGYLHLVRGRVEAGDPPDSAHTVPRGFPKAFTPDSVRADRADSCNDYTPHGFILPLVFQSV
jgi:hypothetical protein